MAVVWFVLYFVVGFFALACLFAVAGALASRVEDLQSTTAPLTTALMLVYFASFGLSGTGAVIASYVPIASVVSMPARILAGEAAWWEPIVSLGFMAAFAAVTVLVGEKVYRRSLLQTRGRLYLARGVTRPRSDAQRSGSALPRRTTVDAGGSRPDHLEVRTVAERPWRAREAAAAAADRRSGRPAG